MVGVEQMDEQRKEGSRQKEMQREEEVEELEEEVEEVEELECEVVTKRLPKRRKNGNIA